MDYFVSFYSSSIGRCFLVSLVFVFTNGAVISMVVKEYNGGNEGEGKARD